MKDYFEKIGLIRSMFNDIAITTDCLAGFVGETLEEFNTTYNNIIKLGFADCHIFPYSKRLNTKAYDLPNHLDPSIIKERAHKLQTLAKELKLKYYNQFIGTVQSVLMEQLKNGYWYGHTSNYLEVKVKDNSINLTNQVVRVRLIKVINGTILAEEEA